MDVLRIWEELFPQFSNKKIDTSMSSAQIGDLIEFVYPNAGFSLWAVYDGDEHVVHFGLADENMMVKLLRGVLQQMFQGSNHLLRTAVVRRQRIAELKLPLGVHIKVNNSSHDLWPSPETLVKQRCDTLIGQQFTYDVVNLNCEHFATYVRYGRAVCNQIPFKARNQEHVAATQTFEKMTQPSLEVDTYL